MDRREDNGTFTQIPNVFLDTCDLPESAQILYMRLYRHIHYTGGIFRGSVRTLSNLVRLSKSTTDRMVKKLHDSHLVTLAYEKGKENNREIMIITLHKDQLWALNKSYSAGNTVPNWDNTMPDCPKLGQNVPERDEVSQDETESPNLGRDNLNLGQNVPGSSSNEGTIILNNSNNSKESEEKPVIPSYLLKAINKILSQCAAVSHEQILEQDIAYVVEVWQYYNIQPLIFKQLLEEALANSQGRGIEYMLNTLASKAAKTAQQSVKQEAQA